MKKTILLKLCLFLLVVYQPTQAWEWKDLWEARAQGEYGKAWLVYQELSSASSPESLNRSEQSQIATFFCEHKLSRSLSLPCPKGPDDEPDTEGLVLHDALTTIVQEAKHHRIVILNEEHNNSHSRAFAQELFSALRKDGFRVLAAETFSQNIQEQKFLTEKSGYYTSDPFFADFIRWALSHETELVAYESTGRDESDALPTDSINRREKEQAENLIERALKILSSG